MKSENYKTSIIYGEKIIVCGKDVQAQLKKYIEEIRSFLITKGGVLPEETHAKSEQYVFTTRGNACMMKHKDIAACLTSSFRKAGMNTEDLFDFVIQMM